MKRFSSILVRMVLVAVSTIALAGCQMKQGGTLEKPAEMRYVRGADGCVFGAGTVGTSMDASFTAAAKYCRHPKTGKWHEMNADGTFGPTVAGQALVAIAGTLPAATMQAAGGVVAAGRKSSGGAGPVVHTQAVSQQSQGQSSESTTTVGGCGGPCM